MQKQIPALSELTQADADDLLIVRDVDSGVDKKISYQNAIQVQSVAGKQGVVTLDFDDIGGSIANGQVPESSITQHAAALNNLAASNVLQVQAAVLSQAATYSPGTTEITLTLTVTPRRADSYLLVEFDDFVRVFTDGSPSSHRVQCALHWSRGDTHIATRFYNDFSNSPAEIPVSLKSIRPSVSTDSVVFSVRYFVLTETLVRRSVTSSSFTSDMGYHSLKVTEMLLAQTSGADT